MDVKAVNRELRRVLWVGLRDEGFDVVTARSAWRYWDGGVDVVDVRSIGAGWEATGCTSYSFGAMVASLPDYVERSQRIPVGRDGRLRPHYWDSSLQLEMTKSLSQPWFRPFAAKPKPTLTEPMRLHREGLMQVLRRDVHDRPDIWFVLEDGSNLNENVADLTRAVTNALPVLERLHDPCEVVKVVHANALPLMRAGSPAAEVILTAATRRCRERGQGLSREGKRN